MKAIIAIAAALAALTPLPVQAADMTSAKTVSCMVAKGGRCKADGTCTWRDATERDKGRILVLELEAKIALMQFNGKRKKMGIVAADKVEKGVRHVVVKRKANANPKFDMVLKIKKSGAFSGSRARKRVRFTGTCKAG